jgi:leucyl-tRNA synthetase
LEDLNIKYANEAEDKIKEECCPGAPFITFIVKPSINVHFINPQKCNGSFDVTIKISNGDTVKQIILKIAEKINIKGIYNIK